ncbi:MAG: hypothetical protein EPO36_09765 [Chloroflexota bacterium]|nr:MAG: hypothetical protein EPO36_09765 [Chloroflexota bacterium]
MRILRPVAFPVLAMVMLVACASNPTPPPDAQYVRVLANDVAIRLDPATVHAGNTLYLVLEPPTDHIVFIEAKSTAEAVPGPLTDADLARVAAGDLQGTSLQGFEMTGCAGDALKADRGKLRVPGNCGNVFWLPDLEPGRYAFLLEDPTGLPRAAPIVMAVLEVTP